ncbi:hypothetical protein NPIL_435761 [Nephila pilipes]|uniref:Uncharacterized protein n=1 Tax=Nephila pilipes TaxID=299642 RepID=A0A8X6QGA7_NEPPI|nr:hypothetical protein NPIL_435761 [Nephila pilipes]
MKQTIDIPSKLEKSMSEKCEKRDATDIHEKMHSPVFPFCESIEILEPTATDEKKEVDSDFVTELQPLLTAFLFTGLDFRSPKRRQFDLINRSREIAIRVGSILNFIICFISVLLSVYKTDTRFSRKHGLINQILVVNFLSIRSVLFCRRKNIANLLWFLSKSYDKITHKSKYLNKSMISIIISLQTGLYLLLYWMIFLANIGGTVANYAETRVTRGTRNSHIPRPLLSFSLKEINGVACKDTCFMSFLITPEKQREFNLRKDNAFRINPGKVRKVTANNVCLARVPARSVNQVKDSCNAIGRERFQRGGVTERYSESFTAVE